MNIGINDLLKKCLFKNGVFNRWDMVLRLEAARTWLNKREIDSLWWRMQYVKLFYWAGVAKAPYWRVSEDVERQIGRLIQMSTLIKGGVESDPIWITDNLGLIDGAHRLAAYMACERKTIPAITIPDKKVSKTSIIYYPIGWISMFENLYTQRELEHIASLRGSLEKDIAGGRWGNESKLV